MTAESSGGWVPIAEAAGELETTVLKVLMLIKQAALCGREGDGGWLVSRQSLDGLAAQGVERGHRGKGGCGGCSACS